jgi:hypothetical protein
MSRRTLQHPIGRLAKAQQRMAPGGIRWSESPVPRRYSPRVPMLGAAEEPPSGPDLWWQFDGDGTNSSDVWGSDGDLVPSSGTPAFGSDANGGYVRFYYESPSDRFFEYKLELPSEFVTFADTLRVEATFTAFARPEGPTYPVSVPLTSTFDYHIGIHSPSVNVLPTWVHFPDGVQGTFGSAAGTTTEAVGTVIPGWYPPTPGEYTLHTQADTATGQVVCTLNAATATHPDTADDVGPVPDPLPSGAVRLFIKGNFVNLYDVKVWGMAPKVLVA